MIVTNPNDSGRSIYVATEYRVLYEDDFFLAVEKPAPLPVHPVGRFKEKNLLSFLKRDLDSNGTLHIVNRLDSETSGLVLVAKSSGMAGKLGKLFQERQVYKEYYAVVFGVPEVKEGTVSISLGSKTEDSHHFRVPDPNGQTARTDYQVLKDLGNSSLLKVIPHTGRTHQIRAHLAFLGHPIIGDKIYIDARIFERYIREGWQEDMRPVVGADRLQLHATRLQFRHPETREEMSFVSESSPPLFSV